MTDMLSGNITLVWQGVRICLPSKSCIWLHVKYRFGKIVIAASTCEKDFISVSIASFR